MNVDKLKMSLLYRGSRDGFSCQDFHSKCDYKGATLTVVKSDYNKIFGGFTSKSWEPTYTMDMDGDLTGDHIKDDLAFIFSLTHLKRF